MKKITVCKSVFIVFALVLLSTTALRAETTQKFNLSVGGYFGLGGATDYGNADDHGAFALGLQPELQFFPVDNLSVTFRCLWERIFYDYRVYVNGRWRYYEAPLDIIPFLFGVRLYYPVFNKTKIFIGGGIGAAVLLSHPDVPGWDHDPDARARFAMDFSGGVEYEVMNQLAITCMFNTLLPNIEHNEGVIARFIFFFGVNYYIPL